MIKSPLILPHPICQHPYWHWPLVTYLSKPSGHFLQTLSFFYFHPLGALDIDNHSSFFEIVSSFATALFSGLLPVLLTAIPLLFSFPFLSSLFKCQLYLGICLHPTSHLTHLSHISHFCSSPSPL